MAEIKWTDSQLKAIEKRGKNILVSAAAGSGKTAVLVERVMRLIMEGADLDELMIMTFTKAAAAQMKSKIYGKIRDALKADPENDHLRSQQHRVHNAKIFTIDALCNSLVRENFQDVDVDPGFRIADESELNLIKADVLADLIRDNYERQSPEFIELVQFYIDKSDSKLEDIILQFYTFSQSHPDPERWIRRSVEPYTTAEVFGCIDGESEEEYEERSAWTRELKKQVNAEFAEVRKTAIKGLRVSQMNYGPEKYVVPFEQIISFIDSVSEELKTCDCIKEELDIFLDTWENNPRVTNKDGYDEALKKFAQDTRNGIKATLKKIRDSYFPKDLDGMFADMAECKTVAGEIRDLTLDFAARFLEAKKEKMILGFEDVSHFALKILISYDENGTKTYTKTADRLANGLREIIVDEYQDTNELQEEIIKALSAERFGRPDVFMVGDVKQSIYGFRMANPEMFIEKFNEYEHENETNCRILLNANFRSRAEVLNITNYIFDQAMIDEVGGIDYSNGHWLELGADYPKPEKEGAYTPELIFVDCKGKEGKQLEAYKIAEKIRDLIQNGKVSDGKGGLRGVRYGDIAILTRQASNPEIEQELDNNEIPTVKASNSGFFGSFEIRLLMDLLNIIDNPFQNIEFTAVLTSPLVGLSAQEIARLKIDNTEPEFSVYSSCRKSENPEIKAFIARLDEWRNRCCFMGLCDFLEFLLDDSGFYNIVLAMPRGEVRQANIEFLKSKAQDFSKTSGQGLYSFIKYIKQIKDADIDYGQAQIFAEDANAVHMMTIHKSKGLEFPVVILANAGKKYNETDLRDNIILDRELGIGLEKRDPKERIITRTLLMETIKNKKRIGIFAEEMRLLYVAMTRAKEKLIISSSCAGVENLLAKCGGERFNLEKKLAASTVTECDSYQKLISHALIRHSNAGELCSYAGIEILNESPVFNGTCSFEASVLNAIDVEEERVLEVEEEASKRESFESLISGAMDGKKADRSVFEFEYPYKKATTTNVKLTASGLENHDEADRVEVNDRRTEELMLKGAERGNAYHRFFELLDYSLFDPESSDEELNTQLTEFAAKMQEQSLISEEYVNAVKPEHMIKFLRSNLGRRMKAAAAAGKLHREQQFIMRMPEDGETRLLQGIIDAFFEEDGQMILVDYKTDRGKIEEDFAKMYKPQQDAYLKAIESAYGMPVAEEILYSVELGKEIII